MAVASSSLHNIHEVKKGVNCQPNNVMERKTQSLLYWTLERIKRRARGSVLRQPEFLCFIRNMPHISNSVSAFGTCVSYKKSRVGLNRSYKKYAYSGFYSETKTFVMNKKLRRTYTLLWSLSSILRFSKIGVLVGCGWNLIPRARVPSGQRQRKAISGNKIGIKNINSSCALVSCICSK